MKSRIRLVLTALVLLTIPAVVSAAGPFYVTAAVANASTDLDVEAEFQRLIDDEDEGWSVGVGFHISRFVAIEGAYHDLGTVEDSSGCPPDALCAERLIAPAQADSTAVTVSVLPHWPVTENFSVYGRLGVASWESDISNAFNDFRLESADGEDLVLGVGVRLLVAGPFGAFAEFSRIADTFETLSIGASWGF